MSFKLKQRIAAFIGAFALVGVMPVTSQVNQVCAVETAATECKANLNIMLDSGKYLIGDTVTARLSISGLGDEANAGIQIAAMEAHLIFDNNKLEFLPDETEFMEPLKSSIESGSSESYLGVSKNYPERLVAYFAYNSGGYQLGQEEGDLMVAEFKFKVKDTVKKGDEIKVDFDENPINEGSAELRYENVLMRPLTDDIKPNDALFELGTVSHLPGYVVDVVFITSNCNYFESNHVIGGNVYVALSDKDEYESAWVVVKLYDNETGLTKAVKQQKVKDLESRTWNFEFDNITSINNLKIKYFLWDSPTNMCPISESFVWDIWHTT